MLGVLELKLVVHGQWDIRTYKYVGSRTISGSIHKITYYISMEKIERRGGGTNIIYKDSSHCIDSALRSEAEVSNSPKVAMKPNV